MSTLQINKTKVKQQTQLLPSRNAASRPSSLGSLLGLLPSFAFGNSRPKGRAQTFALATIAFVSLAGITYLLHPFSIDNSYAETTESASAEMSVNLDPTITIWTTDTNNNNIDSINIAADPDETVYTGTGRVHVSTNNLTGYTLTIQSSNTDAKMKHEDESVTKTINPITGTGTSAASWTSNSDLNNMWGYSIGSNDSFKAVPGSSTAATTINSTDTPNNDNSTDITFAAKADLSLPAGTYKDTVVFSVVANAIPTPFQNGDTMQSEDAVTKCANSKETTSLDDVTTYELIDVRNSEPYYIRKFGNYCVMVENLYLVTGTNLNSSTSDISSTYTIPISVQGTDRSDLDDVYVINRGRNRNGYSYTCDEDDVAEDKCRETGVHALDGSLYPWQVATADTGDMLVYNQPTGSICPNNWHLPSMAEYNEIKNTINTSYNLFFIDALGNSQAPILSGTGYENRDVYIGGEVAWWTTDQHNQARQTAVGRQEYGAKALGMSSSSWFTYDGERSGMFNVRCVLSSE